jgi:hypothetical protein
LTAALCRHSGNTRNTTDPNGLFTNGGISHSLLAEWVLTGARWTSADAPVQQIPLFVCAAQILRCHHLLRCRHRRR